MSDTERAWAAGLFDGEGYIGFQVKTLRGRRYFQPHMAMTNTDRLLLVRFAAVAGGRVPEIPWQNPRPNYQPKWQWKLTSRDTVRDGFEALAPWLSPTKLEAGRIVLGGRLPEVEAA